MSKETKHSIIYLDSKLHETIRLKAERMHRSVSAIVNDAVQIYLQDDLEDAAIFDDRATEPEISYETLRQHLKI